MTRLLLAVDYDGVIADTNSMKSDWIKGKLCLDNPPWKCDRTNCVPLIGERLYNEMGEFVYGNEGSSQANPVPGALKGIQNLVNLGWMIHIVTARSEERIQWAQKWVNGHGLETNILGLTSSEGSRKLDLAEIMGAAAILDDDLRHLVKIPKSNVRTWHLASNLRVAHNTIQGITHMRNWSAVVRFASQVHV